MRIEKGIKLIMKELELDVTGMMCTGCENRIKNALSEIKGIESVEANHETGKVKITSKNEIDKTKAKEIIERLEFKVNEN